jgi:membrane protein insertase Oxa1/YidC/SpoIIIJ
VYWFGSNIATMLQTYLISRKSVRDYFKIAELKKIPNTIQAQTGIKPKLSLKQAYKLANSS